MYIDRLDFYCQSVQRFVKVCIFFLLKLKKKLHQSQISLSPHQILAHYLGEAITFAKLWIKIPSKILKFPKIHVIN